LGKWIKKSDTGPHDGILLGHYKGMKKRDNGGLVHSMNIRKCHKVTPIKMKLLYKKE
jgi:hypothetical protein